MTTDTLLSIARTRLEAESGNHTKVTFLKEVIVALERLRQFETGQLTVTAPVKQQDHGAVQR